MNINNQCYKMFELMMHGYKNNNKDELEQGARCWARHAPQNPFEFDSDEMDAFFHIQACYQKWSSGGIDHKINRRRMIMWAEKLCSLDPKNPYKFDKKAEEEELRLEKEKYEKSLIKEEPKVEKVVLEKPITVTNTLPEEKKNWLNFLFPWKKEGVSNDSKGTN